MQSLRMQMAKGKVKMDKVQRNTRKLAGAMAEYIRLVWSVLYCVVLCCCFFYEGFLLFFSSFLSSFLLFLVSDMLFIFVCLLTLLRN